MKPDFVGGLRTPDAREAAWLERLLGADFRGAEVLRCQSTNLLVESLDSNNGVLDELEMFREDSAAVTLFPSDPSVLEVWPPTTA